MNNSTLKLNENLEDFQIEMHDHLKRVNFVMDSVVNVFKHQLHLGDIDQKTFDMFQDTVGMLTDQCEVLVKKYNLDDDLSEMQPEEFELLPPDDE